MKNLVWLAVFGLCFAAGVASADTKIVKWVDKHGVTHYGDKPPSFDESKSSQELNKQGLITKKNAPVEQKNVAQDAQMQAQDRKDKILLASYTSVHEIDLARDRSLEMNKAAMTSLNSQKESLTARIARNKITADDFKSRNKPLPANLDSEFKEAVAQSGRLDKQMTDRTVAMEQTNKNYAEDKARYLILKQPAAAASPAPELASAPSAPAEKTPLEKTQVEVVHIDKK